MDKSLKDLEWEPECNSPSHAEDVGLGKAAVHGGKVLWYMKGSCEACGWTIDGYYCEGFVEALRSALALIELKGEGGAGNVTTVCSGCQKRIKAAELFGTIFHLRDESKDWKVV